MLLFIYLNFFLIKINYFQLIFFQRHTVHSMSKTNLIPQYFFHKFFFKKLYNLFLINKIREDFIPYYYHILIRFLEHSSGKKYIIQIYPFLNQNIELSFLIRYKI